MPKDQHVSRELIAFVLDVDERTITNLVKDHDGENPFPSRVVGKSRTFPVARCVQWYVKFKMDEAAKRANPKGEQLSVLDQVKTRKELAQAIRAELEVAEARGELLPIAMHEDRVAQLCERLAARCKTLGRYRGEVQRAMTDLEAAQLLERIIDELLRSLMSVADEIEEPDGESVENDGAVTEHGDGAPVPA